MSRVSSIFWNLPEVAQGGNSVVLFCAAIVVVDVVDGVVAAVVDGCNVVNLLVD